MKNNPAAIAEAFYIEMSKKNVDALEKYLHQDVQFSSPFAKTKGKDGYLEAVRKFTSFFNKLTIRTKFGSDNQAMVVYDIDFPQPIGAVPTSALLTFQKDLITKIELFFDARSFEKK